VSVAALREKPVEPQSLFPTRAVWTLALNSPLTVPPAFDATHVYFGLSDDRFVAYTLPEGTQQWLVSARSATTPAVGDGRLFMIEAPDGLVSRRAADGTVDYVRKLPGAVTIPPVWDIGWLALATTSGSVLVYRASDGELIWQRDLGSPAHAMPVLAGDRVYVPTEDARVVALRVDTGEPVWERRLGGPANGVLALDDRVYVGSQDNFLYCLLTKNGRVDWRWRTGGDIVGVPAADDHHVYFVSLDNVFRGLDRISGVQQWMRTLPVRPVWGPVLVGNQLIVGGQASVAQAYKTKDGSPAGNVDGGAEIAAPPRIVEDPSLGLPTVLVVTRDLARGAAARLLTRRLEPEATQLAEPLPNVISMAPKVPTR
jgi:outer membrane protein assembly factor BamB